MLTHFDYKLTGLGWAELTLASDTDSFCITISYTSDPLPDLLVAVTKLKSNASRFEIVNSTGDNYDHDILLTEVEEGILRIEVMKDAYLRNIDDAHYEKCPMPVFTTYDNKRSFCEMVKNTANNLARDGIGKYNIWWSNSRFPEEELIRLNGCFKS